MYLRDISKLINFTLFFLSARRFSPVCLWLLYLFLFLVLMSVAYSNVNFDLPIMFFYFLAIIYLYLCLGKLCFYLFLLTFHQRIFFPCYFLLLILIGIASFILLRLPRSLLKCSLGSFNKTSAFLFLVSRLTLHTSCSLTL